MSNAIPLLVFTDGACRGNPGPASVGVYGVHALTKEPVFSFGYEIGKTTNNVAEYAALALALLHITTQQFTGPLTICADSLLLVKQMNGEFKVKHPNIIPWYQFILSLRRMAPFTIKHVLREKNVHADALANQALDDHHALPTTLAKFLTPLHKPTQSCLW